MKIIISPAKKMNEDTDSIEITGMPGFINDAKILMHEMKSMSLSEGKKLWKCNDKLAELNHKRYKDMSLVHRLTPAVIAYEGLQYQHMAPKVLTSRALSYLSDHLRILSGFYGVLRPFDGVTPYRLEMQAKLSVNDCKDLYDFWGDRLYHSLMDDDRIILNLASREYSQCIEKYITPKDRFITIEFGELVEGKVKQKGPISKIARGGMVRFMAENNISDLNGLKDFKELGFTYSKELSSDSKYVFLV